MDGGDAGMIEARQSARFPLEAKPPLFVFEELLRQYLDRDVSREARVSRPVHLPHPARAERREDLVGAEVCAGGERHLDSGIQPTRTVIGTASSPGLREFTMKRFPSGVTS